MKRYLLSLGLIYAIVLTTHVQASPTKVERIGTKTEVQSLHNCVVLASLEVANVNLIDSFSDIAIIKNDVSTVLEVAVLPEQFRRVHYPSWFSKKINYSSINISQTICAGYPLGYIRLHKPNKIV